MFCEKCGTKLLDTAEFCTNCGTHISGSKETIKEEAKKIVDKEIQLQVKPTYKFGYMALPSLLVYIFLIAITLFIFISVDFLVGMVITFITIIIFGGIWGIQVAINRKQYKNYTYDFYKTKVIYKDSFLNVSEKEVKYKYIREITMRQTFIQRYFDLGSVILYTKAETGLGNGIFIKNISNVQEIYKQIKEITNV